jgi:DNA-binding NarL/FixJ family response regulator
VDPKATSNDDVVTVLLVDSSAHTVELFADVIRARLGFQVLTIAQPTTAVAELLDGQRPDVAIVDVAFGDPPMTGLDVMMAVLRTWPDAALVALVQGDGHQAELVREAWELLPLATVMNASAPVADQLEQIRRVARDRSAEPDPATRQLLSPRNPNRTLQSFARLVQHRGHAKLWCAVLTCGPGAEYQDLAEVSGLRVNALRNYRAQLLPELELHGLRNPPMRDLYAFASRCRPFLAPYIEAKGISLDS